jgi:hypothetical protein
MTSIEIIEKCYYFLSEFRQFNSKRLKRNNSYTELEKTIDAYTYFISSNTDKNIWENISSADEIIKLESDLREEAILCLRNFEKYKAKKLQENKLYISDYFKDMKICIESEISHLNIASNSKVIFIGTGAFPTSILQISRRTGADIFGIDNDNEAVHLAGIVISKLGSGERIAITASAVDQLPFTKTATHIILASTVNSKFDILKQLYHLTNKNIVVAVRYGDGIKSLFNYPLQKTDESLWKLVNTISMPNDIFDTAIYRKNEKGCV